MSVRLTDFCQDLPIIDGPTLIVQSDQDHISHPRSQGTVISTDSGRRR